MALLTPEQADLIAARMRGDAPRPRRREPRIPRKKRDHIYARDNWTCQECGSTERLTLDHIVPHSRGGSSAYANLRTLCWPCNSAKADAFPDGATTR